MQDDPQSGVQFDAAGFCSVVDDMTTSISAVRRTAHGHEQAAAIDACAVARVDFDLRARLEFELRTKLDWREDALDTTLIPGESGCQRQRLGELARYGAVQGVPGPEKQPVWSLRPRRRI